MHTGTGHGTPASALEAVSAAPLLVHAGPCGERLLELLHRLDRVEAHDAVGRRRQLEMWREDLEGRLAPHARSARQSRVPEGGQLRLRQRAHRLGVALVAVKIVLLQRRHLVPVAGRLLPQLLVFWRRRGRGVRDSPVANMLLPGSTLLLAPLLAPPPARHAPPAMGGYTGLPRMPVKAWPLTRRWNPTLEYRENIATLWRDLETLYAVEGSTSIAGGGVVRLDASRSVKGDKTGLSRGLNRAVDLRAELVYEMARREPSLLNPAVSNRFVFAESKRLLALKLGSEEEAIEVMRHDPSILQAGDAIEGLGVAQIRGRAFAARLRRAGPPVLAAALLAAAAAAYLGPEGVAFMMIADW
mmetsp:Transcript_30837/g.100709  ORF Transcript_30837/g.100709 Transcript_30837/m.100709 type:complete len:357 (-) Transcript_30837:285-1355(-)